MSTSDNPIRQVLTFPTITSQLTLADMKQIEYLVRKNFSPQWVETKNSLSDDVVVCDISKVPLSSWCLYCSSLSTTWLVYKDDKGDCWAPWGGDEHVHMTIVYRRCGDTSTEAVVINSSFLPTPTNAELIMKVDQ